jgi:hypothetical protein
MPGSTEEKSRRYLQLAAENEKRASETKNSELKRKFLELASGYRELARTHGPSRAVAPQTDGFRDS